LEYADEKGVHLASPDLVVPELRLVVECKRTYTRVADAQLLCLYHPLLVRLWPGDWKMVVACQLWAGDEKPLIDEIVDAKPGLNYFLRRF
jgi:hypothetical protein